MNIPFAIFLAIVILIISCLCLIAISTHFVLKAGKTIGEKLGIEFKNVNAFRKLSKTQVVAFDKAGIITEGNPVVTEIFSADHFTMSGYAVGGYSDDELLEVAASLASKSDHKLAKAITKYTNEMIVELDSVVTNFKEYPGKGLEAEVDGVLIRGGNLDFIEEKVVVSPEVKTRADDLVALGKNLVFFSKGKRLLGIIAITDKIKDDSKQAITGLVDMGIKAVMMSRDHGVTEMSIGNLAGIDRVIAGIPLAEKENAIRVISYIGRVALVEDASSRTEVYPDVYSSIAIGADVNDAKDADDVIIAEKSLLYAERAIMLSRKIVKILSINRFCACFLDIICVPFLAIKIFEAFGLSASIVFVAAAMIITLALVLFNTLKIRNFGFTDTKTKE